MLLNNFIATMHPLMNITNTVGTINDRVDFDGSTSTSLSSGFYSDTGTAEVFAPFLEE